MPKLVIGMLPVLPGVFESRHEVRGSSPSALRRTRSRSRASAIHVDEQHANAYPQSLLFGAPPE